MQYVNCNGRVWKMSDREFKRQLTNVANGGDFSVEAGKMIGEIGRRIGDIDQEEAKEMLAYEFATQKQREKREAQDKKNWCKYGISSAWSDRLNGYR